jgi:hypothetical protein
LMNAISTWSVIPKPTPMIPNNFIYLWTNTERRVWDKILYELMAVIFHDNCYNQFCCSFLRWYNNRLLPLTSQFFQIPNVVNEITDLNPQYMVVSNISWNILIKTITSYLDLTLHHRLQSSPL